MNLVDRQRADPVPAGQNGLAVGQQEGQKRFSVDKLAAEVAADR